jgi:vesicle transport protein SEC22
MIFVSQSNTGVLIHIYALPCADTFIQKTRKLYMDTRTQRNLSKLNDDLFEVQQIMTRNIQEVLGLGDRLDRMSLNIVHQIVVLPCCLRL